MMKLPVLRNALITFSCLLIAILSAGWKNPSRDPPVHKGDEKLFSKSYIISRMKKVADWQLANPVSFNPENEMTGRVQHSTRALWLLIKPRKRKIFSGCAELERVV